MILLFCLLSGCSSGNSELSVSFQPKPEGNESEITLDESTVLPEGLYIDQIYAGGKTVGEIRSKLEEAYAEAGQTKATVYWGVNPVETNLANLGLYWQIDDVLARASRLGTQGLLVRQYKSRQDLNGGEYHIEMGKRLTQSAVENFLQEYVANVYDVAPTNAKLTRVSGGFEVSQSSTGLGVNFDKTWKLLSMAYAEIADGSNEPIVVQAVIEDTQPHYPDTELMKIEDCLGSSYTNYGDADAPYSRAVNVEVATRNINGALLMPGESASTSELMKPRTEENGYMTGGTQENGEIVDSIGGGICQASTTLYNALLKAEIQIDERYNHSMRVMYVDPAKDAAISDSKDLVFTNNTEAPIYIEGYTDGTNVYFSVYGQETRPENRKVTYESKVLFEKEYLEGGTEVDAELWKVVTVDGEEISRDLMHKDHYEPSSRLNGTIN